MKNLTTRVLSALIALISLSITLYFFKIPGLIVFSYLVGIIGIYEMSHLFFKKGFPQFSKTFFFIISGLFLYSTFQEKLSEHLYEIIVLVISIITVTGILFHKKFDSIDSILIYFSKFILGLIYSASLPALIIAILKTEKSGFLWFCCLLTVVFAGDIGAFIFGTLFGKTKIAPLLSPKKSLEGSLGGLLFSSLAGLAFYFIIPDVNMILMIFLGLFGGALGQIGDFFESLMKRIAGVKDSGSIMPGHGGVLDRLDGVYFASPLFYLVIKYII